MIQVIQFSVEPDDSSGIVRGVLGASAAQPAFTAELKLKMDAKGLEVFLSAMERACPGFRARHTGPAAAAPRALTAGRPALPPTALEAEFEDP